MQALPVHDVLSQGSKGAGGDVEGEVGGLDTRLAESCENRFVEVKTTRYGKRTPFYISAGEIRFSKANSDAYQLYRVFEFCERPKLFTLPGDVERNVTLRATNYRAYI